MWILVKKEWMNNIQKHQARVLHENWPKLFLNYFNQSNVFHKCPNKSTRDQKKKSRRFNSLIHHSQVSSSALFMRRSHLGLAYLQCEERQWQQTMAVSDVQTSHTELQYSSISIYKLSAPILIPFSSTSSAHSFSTPSIVYQCSTVLKLERTARENQELARRWIIDLNLTMNLFLPPPTTVYGQKYMDTQRTHPYVLLNIWYRNMGINIRSWCSLTTRFQWN